MSKRRQPKDEEIDFSDIPELTSKDLKSAKRVGRLLMGEMNQPKIRFDDDLRDIPLDVDHARVYVAHLRSCIEATTDTKSRVRLMGEAGVWLRCLGELSDAEKLLTEALTLTKDKGLGIACEIQQRIRLAHVFQWQKRFKESTLLFKEIIATCEQSNEACIYLDFAWQHFGKDLFDQKKYLEALSAFQTALRLRKDRQAPQEQIESTEFAIQRTNQLLT